MQQTKGFELKQKVAEIPNLRFPDFNKLFTVECDASKLAIGAIFNQEGHPVAFFSEKLNEAKQKYSTYDLELYAMVQALKKWQNYLLPKEFIVYIDNHALSFLNGQEKLHQRHLKWVEHFQAYTFSIKHKKGVTNKVADTLSRRALTIQEMKLQSVGLSGLKDLYQGDKDFGEPYDVCTKFANVCHVAYSDFMLQEGLLFKGHLLAYHNAL